MEYLDESKIPPYFEGSREKSHDTEKGAVTKAGSGEADVAAGVLQRVSSFSMLRSPSTVAATQKKEERIESPVEDLQMYTIPHLVPTWRLKDRMKTVGVGLIMCLNIGTDPPDITKPHPCAKLQCWIDPLSMSRSKAKEKIGERLQAQYAKWQQQRAQKAVKYRRAIDPTVEDVRSLCHALRRQARNERVLLHINGQGVPRPTANGELWFFDKAYT